MARCRRADLQPGGASVHLAVMSTPCFSLGLDYGTNTVRAVFVDVADGRAVGSGTHGYAHGDDGIITDDRDPHLARQHPRDYLESLEAAVRSALSEADADPDFAADRVIGIGVDATASTPIPVDADLRALADDERFARDPAALAWLWKDHTAHSEAEEITSLAKELAPEHLARAGGTCSSEWFFPKLLRCQRVAPDVLASAAQWVELGDYVVGLLVGATATTVGRNSCAAGHKALFHESDGLPSAAFFETLDPELAEWWKPRRFVRVAPAGVSAGGLSKEWSQRLGLPAGIAVSMAAIDAHVGAVGAGVRPGTLVKILGTSSCDMLVHPAAGAPLCSIPGLNGVVRDSILPEHWGIEAGQCAVGDIFGWFVREFGRPAGQDHASLTADAAALPPGATGLVALDWNNGNRSILNNPRLTGLLVGQTLRTRPAEVYRALLESTALGARVIVDRLVEYGVAVDRVVFCGGIAEKNDLLVSIYADVLERPILRSRSPETCALGAALFGAVAAGPTRGGPKTIAEAQRQMTGTDDVVVTPDADRVLAYRELLAIYRKLHDAFGTRGNVPLDDVMGRLLALAESAAR